MMLNGIGHLAVMIIRKSYFPGGITALFLVIAAAVLVYSLVSMKSYP